MKRGNPVLGPGLLALGAALPAASFAEAPEAGALTAEVRVFEIRRITSDFSPVVGLSFPLDTDGTRVRPSEWLATLARRIPDSYFAQLATVVLPPESGAAGGSDIREAALQNGPRSVAVRLRLDPDQEEPARDGGETAGSRSARLRFGLYEGDSPAQQVERAVRLTPGRTHVFSGRDLEITPTRYLSWFREPRDTEQRGALYERLRERTIFLALAVTLRPVGAATDAPPVLLEAPGDPRLRMLESALIGEARGSVRLGVRIDGDGMPFAPQVLRATLPEVTPRVLGILSDWRFPSARNRYAQLTVPVATERSAEDRQ